MVTVVWLGRDVAGLCRGGGHGSVDAVLAMVECWVVAIVVTSGW